MSLVVKNLNFSYKDHLILKNISFSTSSDEVLVIKGKSGIGKSTLGKILAGYMGEDFGDSIFLDGEKLELTKFKKNCLFPVQMLFQMAEESVNPIKKIRDIIFEPDNETYDLDDNFFHSFKIDKKWLNKTPGEFSGGELQRICIARILKKNYGIKYLILDEATNQLNFELEQEIYKTIYERAKLYNIGLIIISHNDNFKNGIESKIVELFI